MRAVKLKTSEAALCWLPELRINDDSSDVVLHTLDGYMTYAHAFVLGAVASRNVLSALSKVHETDADKLHISLSGHTKQQLDHLLDFIYGKLETFEDVEIWKDLFVFHVEESIGEVKDEDEDEDEVETETETSRTSSSIENLSSRTASVMRLNACWDDSENFETSITEDVDEEEEDSDHVGTSSIRKKRLKRFPDKKGNALGALTPSSKVWTCPECHEEAGLFPEMLQHLNKVHPEVAAYGRKIACENCAEHFETKEGFLIHHHGTVCQSAGEGEKRFQCQECPLSFRGFRNLEVHANLQHLSPDQSTRWTLNNRWSVFYCECCLKVFHRVNLLRSHQEKVHKIRRGYFTQDYDKLSMEMQAAETKTSRNDVKKASQHFCKTCNKEFSSKNSFVKHLRDRHQGGGDDQGNSSYECKRCGSGESLRSRRAYLAHMKECGRTIPCKQCTKMFATQKSLNNHVTTFHNQQVVHEKVILSNGRIRYKCDLCSGLFSTNQNVHRHKDGVHSSKEGPKRYNCQEDGCQYKTNVLQNYNEHLRVHRPAEHVCERCGGSFISIYNLRKHVTIAHSDEEWLCDSCPKKFTNPLSLKRHRSTHAEKSLPCHVCGKQFRSSSNLRQHMLSHSDRRPFVCPVCQSGFKTKDKLQRHQKGHCKGIPNAKLKQSDQQAQNGEPETEMETSGEIPKVPQPLPNLPSAPGLLPTQPPGLPKVPPLPLVPSGLPDRSSAHPNTASGLPKLPNAPLVLPKTPLLPVLPNVPVSSILPKAAPVLPNTSVVLSKHLPPPVLPSGPPMTSLAISTPQLFTQPHYQMAPMPANSASLPLVMVSAISVVPMTTIVQSAPIVTTTHS